MCLCRIMLVRKKISIDDLLHSRFNCIVTSIRRYLLTSGLLLNVMFRIAQTVILLSGEFKKICKKKEKKTRTNLTDEKHIINYVAVNRQKK